MWPSLSFLRHHHHIRDVDNITAGCPSLLHPSALSSSTRHSYWHAQIVCLSGKYPEMACCALLYSHGRLRQNTHRRRSSACSASDCWVETTTTIRISWPFRYSRVPAALLLRDAFFLDVAVLQFIFAPSAAVKIKLLSNL